MNSVHLADRRITPRAPSPDALAFVRAHTADQLRARAVHAEYWLDRAAGQSLAHRIETSKGEIQ